MKSQLEINKLLDSLAMSKFRGSFHLNKKMKDYVKDKGINKITSDAYDFISKRIASINPKNDGRQTPMKANSHPVFIAQHACGCCCRSCLEKIHHIEKNKQLSKVEVDYVVKVLITWINKEINN